MKVTKNSRRLKENMALSSGDIGKQLALYESTAVKEISELVKQMSLYESPALKQASEIVRQMSLNESPVLKQANEIAKQMSLFDSQTLKQASKMAKQMSLYDSSTIKQANELVKQLSIFDSVTLKFAAEMSRPFAIQEAASLMAAGSLGRMFAANDSDAICAVREMSESILQQNLFNIIDTDEIDVGFEINAEVIENTVTELGTVSLPANKSGILQWYNNQPPVIQLVIGLILSYWVGVFCNLSMPLYEDWSHIFTDTNTRVASKQVVEEANKEYDITELHNYRFVTASILNVRNKPTINSEILDELKNGKTVKFIKKSKRWVLIEYLCDQTGDYQQGWVFARYLHRFEI